MSQTLESSPSNCDAVRRKADACARKAHADALARFDQLRQPLAANVPIVSAVIERDRDGEKEILMQTRWKPERDPQDSGTLEIAV
jgi:hypothetical protein